MNFKEHIDYIKGNCDQFIKDVHAYMVKTNWTWYDSKTPPTEERIREGLFEILDNMPPHTITSQSGGFTVFKNELFNTVECYFGEESNLKKGIVFCSNPELFDVVDNFINYVCENNPVINKDYLKKLYNQFNNDSTSNQDTRKED